MAPPPPPPPPPSSSTDSTTDYYTLLSIPLSASDSEIRRAYRKTSLLYHPDKVQPTPENLEKFQLLQTAIAVLGDPAEKSKYDANLEAKRKREAEHAALEGRRRKMKEELEARERGMGLNGRSNGGVHAGVGVKRAWSERELEINRIAEENRRRREEMVAKRAGEARKQQEEDEWRQRQKEDAEFGVGGSGGISSNGTGANDSASMEQKSIKVRWVKEGDGLDIDDIALMEMFPQGDVENVILMKDKKRKLEGRDRTEKKGKVMLGTAVLIFKSLTAAKKAVIRPPPELESAEFAATAAAAAGDDANGKEEDGK